MTLRSLLARLRNLLAREPQTVSASLDSEDFDESLDPFNPFPEPFTVEFRDVLDLHSIPPRQVRAVVEDYISEANARSVKWVRIIHGKGVGVQREIVRSLLAASPLVEDFGDAPPEAGGWGATVVTLAGGQAAGPIGNRR